MAIPESAQGAVSLGPLVATGLAIAFFHAALPTHWLPFVIAARTRHWSVGRTLSVNLAAGLSHAAFTALLGAGIAWAGWVALEHSIEVFPPIIAAAVAGVGALLIFRWWKGRDPHPFGHHHGDACRHDLPHVLTGEDQDAGDKAVAFARTAAASVHIHHKRDHHVIAGLVTLVTLSPCESFLPVYLAGAPAGIAGFAVLTLTLTVGTILGMALLTWLTFHAAARAPLDRLARHEGLVLGGLLVALGIGIAIGGH
jgi:hypothetical protein